MGCRHIRQTPFQKLLLQTDLTHPQPPRAFFFVFFLLLSFFSLVVMMNLTLFSHIRPVNFNTVNKCPNSVPIFEPKPAVKLPFELGWLLFYSMEKLSGPSFWEHRAMQF